ncbi:MAG: phosphatase PAP2 family protein [Euryarchaeota archaeon]|nr:phosphatase PAP2 family protein [Euryarchaeota archaeon]
MRRQIEERFLALISDNKMILLVLLAAVELTLYRSVHSTGFENDIQPHIMPAKTTLALQGYIGTDGFIATVSSYFYVYGHIFALLLLAGVIFFSKDQKTNMLAVVISFALESLIYLIYPLAPPIRTMAAVPIRVLVFPTSETLISIKYSAFPSGHIIKSALAYLICRRENFFKMSYIYAANTILVSLVVLYLGEHYAVDVVGGILLALLGFEAAKRLGKNYLWKSQEDLSKP